MSTNSFTVRAGEFEGPLDLLLDLIEKRRLFVNDVSIAQVVDDYLGYVTSLEERDIAADAHFVLIASTLLLIKSKSLLPGIKLTEDETSDVEELEQRLKVLSTYKEAAALLAQQYDAMPMFEARYVPQPIRVFAPHESITLERLGAELGVVLARVPAAKERLPEVTVAKAVSIEEMIDRLSKRVTDHVRTSFRSFVGMKDKMDRAERVNVIVGFLAMLELVRHGALVVRQSNAFEDIEIETPSVDVPHYA